MTGAPQLLEDLPEGTIVPNERTARHALKRCDDTMRFIVILAIAVLIGMGSVPAAIATGAGRDCHLKRLASLDTIFSGGLILVPVIINEQSALMALNTQSVITSLNYGAAAGLKFRTTELPDDTSQLFPGPKNCRLASAQQWDHATAYDCPGTAPLHLGMNMLQNLHLYLATKENMLYFTGRDSVPSLPQSSNQPPTPSSAEQ